MLLAPAVISCGGDDEGSLDTWCSVNEQIYAVGDLDAELTSGDPDELRESFAEMRALLDQAAKAAPPDVLADSNTVADAADRLHHVLDGVGYDMSAVEGDAIVDVAAIAAEREAAVERIEAYNARECGLEPPPGDDDEVAAGTDDTGDSGSGATGDVTAEADSAWCTAAQEMVDLSDAMDEVDYTDPAAVEQAVTDFVVAFEAIAPMAPAEIADAVATNLRGAQVLRDALAEADYDFLVADLSAIGELEAETDEARDQIEAYNEAVCGIDPDTDDEDETDSDFDPMEGSVRDQVIAELVRTGFTEEEAACFFDHIDFTDPDGAEDTGAIMEMLDECDIDMSRLMEIGEAMNP